MPTIRNAKAMAKALDTSLRSKNIALSYGECLDIVARQFGLKDWNILSAKTKRQEAAELRRAVALKGWAFLAEIPSAYDHGVEDDVGSSGRRAAVVRLDSETAAGYDIDPARTSGGYVQTVAAAPFRGGKAIIQADLRCEGVTRGATIWARVEAMPGQNLAFDNLKHSPEGWLVGNSPWTSRKIVIDVAPEAIHLHFGFFLQGQGALWAADFSVEEAPATVSVTATPIEQRHPVRWITPVNLNFSEVIKPAGDGRFVDAS